LGESILDGHHAFGAHDKATREMTRADGLLIK
jgi:hypothetical protein